jgi:hypothetical protein
VNTTKILRLILPVIAFATTSCGLGSIDSSPQNNFLTFGRIMVNLSESSVKVGKSISGKVTLTGSNGINSLILELASSNESSAIIHNDNCTLSDTITQCNFTVTGVLPGITEITAYPKSANGSGLSPNPKNGCIALYYCPESATLIIKHQEQMTKYYNPTLYNYYNVLKKGHSKILYRFTDNALILANHQNF